ncbi:MAG: hypothetical protein M1834_009101 [Cirrosporium novae-zelandiae]|nr:MAG: hypothetical protein M1834_003126 [Cirrosporium novae-zelandiae]KAI9737733.1 MAG: hypothetical protein M1834_009101 [Cirrosporium novae-zelandiae]
MPSLPTILLTAVSIFGAGTSAVGLMRRDSWGPAVSLGPTSSYLVNCTTTILPGKMPPQEAVDGQLYLWPGISNGTGDLIQSIIGSYPTDNSWCGATGEQWCASSELFNGTQTGGTKHAGVLGTHKIQISYVLESESTWTWHQKMYDLTDDVLLAEYTTNDGPMTGWGTAVECNDNCTMPTEPHYYYDTVLHLKAADPDFKDTLGASNGATYESFTTPDEGKTWYLGTITIPVMSS